jgi:hypothetical protein
MSNSSFPRFFWSRRWAPPGIGCVRRPSSARLCLRPPAVGLCPAVCVWPAGGGCAPPVTFKKKAASFVTVQAQPSPGSPCLVLNMSTAALKVYPQNTLAPCAGGPALCANPLLIVVQPVGLYFSATCHFYISPVCPTQPRCSSSQDLAYLMKVSRALDMCCLNSPCGVLTCVCHALPACPAPAAPPLPLPSRILPTS